MEDESLDDTPGNLDIRELDLSFRTCSCLRRAGITTVSQLTNLKESEANKIKGIGGVYLEGFIEELEVNGITLKP